MNVTNFNILHLHTSGFQRGTRHERSNKTNNQIIFVFFFARMTYVKFIKQGLHRRVIKSKISVSI